MASFVADAAVVWIFTGASNSASRTIPTADAVFLAVTMWDGTSDTIAATIAGAGPTDSYQVAVVGGAADGVRAYLAVFVGAPAGAQTVVVSGGDAGDGWSCGFRGVDDIDTVTPFDNEVADSTTPLSIAITTTADGLAVGVLGHNNDEPDVSTSDTEVFEAPLEAVNSAMATAAASTPGTGGSVSIDWTVVSSAFLAIGVNLRNAGAEPGGGGITPLRSLLGVGI